MSAQSVLPALHRQEIRRVEVSRMPCRMDPHRKTSTRRSFAGPPGPTRLKQLYEGPVNRPFAVLRVMKINREVRMAIQQ